MAYERVLERPDMLYHYTRCEKVEKILKDGCIRRMGDKECWFCTSLDDTLLLMERTVMNEGQPYYKVGGSIGRYPRFVPEDYVILKLTPRHQNGEWVRWVQELPPDSPPELVEAACAFNNLKLGFRGDMKFQTPEMIEVAPLLTPQTQGMVLSI